MEPRIEKAFGIEIEDSIVVIYRGLAFAISREMIDRGFATKIMNRMLPVLVEHTNATMKVLD